MMYRADKYGIVTDLFIYSDVDCIVMESKQPPYNEIATRKVFTNFEHIWPSTSYSHFKIPLNRWIKLREFTETTLKAFENSNVWCNGNKVFGFNKIEIDGRMKLCTNT
jgi:hypothetical protein